MKEYYSHAGITIYHGDCRAAVACCTCGANNIAAMNGTHDEACLYGFSGAILTDPPYGIELPGSRNPATRRLAGLIRLFRWF